jgi:hypothetical protein
VGATVVEVEAIPVAVDPMAAAIPVMADRVREAMAQAGNRTDSTFGEPVRRR